jgi:hypothetical protein
MLTTIQVPASYYYSDWHQVIENSGYFFSPGAMTFFSSRVLWGSLTKLHDGYLFITSDAKFDGVRVYSVRYWHDGTIDTLGESQATRAKAVSKLAIYRKRDVLPCLGSSLSVVCPELVSAGIWHEELGYCVECSNKYWGHDDEN